MNWKKVKELSDNYGLNPKHYKYIKAYQDHPEGISNTKLGELTGTSKMTGTQKQNLFLELGIVEDISTHPLRRKCVVKDTKIFQLIQQAEKR